MHNVVNALKATALCTFTCLISFYVNFNSIKKFFLKIPQASVWGTDRSGVRMKICKEALATARERWLGQAGSGGGGEKSADLYTQPKRRVPRCPF